MPFTRQSKFDEPVRILLEDPSLRVADVARRFGMPRYALSAAFRRRYGSRKGLNQCNLVYRPCMVCGEVHPIEVQNRLCDACRQSVSGIHDGAV